MDERDKPHVGERIEPAGRPRAPGRLELVQRFLNTLIHDFDIDRLGTAEKARAWLSSNGLVEPGARITEADAARLRRTREDLRALARANRDDAPDPAVVDSLGAAARRTSLRIHVGRDGATSLAPAGRGLDAAVGTLLSIVHEARLTGEWQRMKTCRRCTYAFFDRSKNRSAAWCSMTICGNRTKNRAYRRRRRAATRSTPRSS
jgi:predicted RNA-binding Zn ribbon-like protein